MKNKCLSTSFLLIDSFFQSNPFHVKGLGFDGDAENNLSQEPDGIYLSNRVKLSKQYWDTLNSVLLPELRISCNREYIIPSKKGVTKELPDFAQDISDAKIKIDRFQDEFYIEGAIYFFRFFLPINNDDWSSVIENKAYSNSKSWSFGLIELTFENGTIDLYPAKNNNRQYIVIETSFPCTEAEMHSYVYSILVALGVVTGTIHLDEVFIIASNQPYFDRELLLAYSSLRNTSKSNYNIIATNMWSVKDCLTKNNVNYAIAQIFDSSDSPKSEYEKLMTSKVFNKLVLLLYNNDCLTRAVQIITDAANEPLDYQGALMSVALETITGHFAPKDNPPIETASWNKVSDAYEKMIQELLGGNDIDNEIAKILRNKKNSLNRISNQEKLKSPFTKHGYSISKNELNAINSRNRFLHGNIMGDTIDESFHEIFYTCLVLSKLCYILLLKEAGYSGYIVNSPVIYGCYKAIKAKEPAMVKI